MPQNRKHLPQLHPQDLRAELVVSEDKGMDSVTSERFQPREDNWAQTGQGQKKKVGYAEGSEVVLFLETAQTLSLLPKRQEAKATTSFQEMKPRAVQGQRSSDEEGEGPGTG